MCFLKTFTIGVSIVLLMSGCEPDSPIKSVPIVDSLAVLPGDVNLNGIAGDLEDANWFRDYFVYGIAVFFRNAPLRQTASTDVNRDHTVLSLADFQYLVHMSIGDAVQRSSLKPETTLVIADRGLLWVRDEMGAARIAVSGVFVPSLEADGMEMKYAYDKSSGHTNVLVYSSDASQAFSGNVLLTDVAPVVSTEFATPEGAPVVVFRADAVVYEQNYHRWPDTAARYAILEFTAPPGLDWSLSVRYSFLSISIPDYSGVTVGGTQRVLWDPPLWWLDGPYPSELTVGDTVYYDTVEFRR